MKAHEHHCRKLLGVYGIPTSAGDIVTASSAAPETFKRFANPAAIAKVQVLMGGRGKAGGVVRVKTAEEAVAFCDKFLGKPFSTYQSAGESKIVHTVLFTEDRKILEEYYLGIAIDRSRGLPVILLSREGGVDIEEVVQKNPKAVQRIHFSPSKMPLKNDILPAAGKCFADPSIAGQVAEIAVKLAVLFVEKDAAVCEINPLALVEGKQVLALDAKIVFDDNALYRHADISAMKDPEEEDDRERLAKEVGLSYVSMSGNVGCLVNGAGLAMATMDMIKMAGGEPSNFLDVGGGATADQVREGFKIILRDPRVEAILVNIFGGIMKCDVIAEGVIQASREIDLKVPLVVRLEGTRVEEGRALLKNSGLQIISCSNLSEAAKTAVAKAAEYRSRHVHSDR